MTTSYECAKYLTRVSNVNRIYLNKYYLIINEVTSYRLPIVTNLLFSVLQNNNHSIIVYKKKLIFQFFLRFIKKKLKEYQLKYCNILELFGLSFTTTIKKNNLRLNVGYNHSIYYLIPKDIIIHTKKKYIYVYSSSLQRLNFVISELINFRKVNAYKLKGIKIKDRLFIKKKKKLSN